MNIQCLLSKVTIVKQSLYHKTHPKVKEEEMVLIQELGVLTIISFLIPLRSLDEWLKKFNENLQAHYY